MIYFFLNCDFHVYCDFVPKSRDGVWTGGNRRLLRKFWGLGLPIWIAQASLQCASYKWGGDQHTAAGLDSGSKSSTCKQTYNL